jgi:hypothetical protein
MTASLRELLKKPGFATSCEQWRERQVAENTYRDVYDGRVWKEFQDGFLEFKYNYALMLNLDWFQPYKHTQYSVGVFYAVVLNLPRAERLKVKNVILIGIIPDMKKEPPVARFIQPLVDELKVLWSTGVRMVTEDGNSVLVKAALICAGCDIPASRYIVQSFYYR